MDSTDDGAMSLRFLRRRHSHNRDQFAHGISPHSSFISQRPVSNFSLFTIIILSFLILVLGIFLIWVSMPESLSNKPAITKWHDYTLIEAASFIAKNGTVIVCAVSQPYLPFLNNWLISITRQKHQDKVLVIAEDYGTLDKVNERWPGHAVLIPPDEFGSKVKPKTGASQGFHKPEREERREEGEERNLPLVAN
ncbi:Glycosyltransferase [Quillaja saponaria]|uniref:Glycosyltransferase n=1 Tax=Quillaja saponaria TaxID=32244 RepID=A0AAD7LQZ0_QUISA|nr:Glycosyltransferase [Quillaja saponaria]